MPRQSESVVQSTSPVCMGERQEYKGIAHPGFAGQAMYQACLRIYRCGRPGLQPPLNNTPSLRSARQQALYIANLGTRSRRAGVGCMVAVLSCRTRRRRRRLPCHHRIHSRLGHLLCCQSLKLEVHAAVTSCRRGLHRGHPAGCWQREVRAAALPPLPCVVGTLLCGGRLPCSVSAPGSKLGVEARGCAEEATERQQPVVAQEGGRAQGRSRARNPRMESKSFHTSWGASRRSRRQVWQPESDRSSSGALPSRSVTRKEDAV